MLVVTADPLSGFGQAESAHRPGRRRRDPEVGRRRRARLRLTHPGLRTKRSPAKSAAGRSAAVRSRQPRPLRTRGQLNPDDARERRAAAASATLGPTPARVGGMTTSWNAATLLRPAQRKTCLSLRERRETIIITPLCTTRLIAGNKCRKSFNSGVAKERIFS